MADEFIGTKYTPVGEALDAMMNAKNNLSDDTLFVYLCEVCGKQETLTEKRAYQEGWDYPPFIGVWGVVSPRTCPNCTIEKTAYWRIITEGAAALTDAEKATVLRIMKEVEQ